MFSTSAFEHTSTCTLDTRTVIYISYSMMLRCYVYVSSPIVMQIKRNNEILKNQD